MLANLASELASVGWGEEAMATFAKARETAELAGGYDGMAGLRDVAVAQVRAGLYAQARETAARLRGEDIAAVESELAAAEGRAGRFVSAFQTLGSRDPSGFVNEMARWSRGFEELEPGLFLQIQLDTMRILGWVVPFWKELRERLVPIGDV